MASPTAHPLITLTTDFGTTDAYAGVMKGVIQGINPDAVVVDISHQVAPHDVLHGAFLLGTAYPYFPPATIHVAVVDPGVGTPRRALGVVTPRGCFVAPDNGLLTFPLRESGALEGAPGNNPFAMPLEVPVPQDWKAYSLTNPRYWLHPVSPTFHGRDVFAPVAAHISTGVSLEEVGETVDFLTCLSVPVPRWEGDVLTGHVVRVDAFGNLITTIAASQGVGQGVQVKVRETTIQDISTTYAYGEGLLALAGSHGYIEIAVGKGSAAALLGCGVGEPVRLRRRG